MDVIVILFCSEKYDPMCIIYRSFYFIIYFNIINISRKYDTPYSLIHEHLKDKPSQGGGWD